MWCHSPSLLSSSFPLLSLTPPSHLFLYFYFFYPGLLLLWGLYVVYATWNAKRVLESRWLLIATYNLCLLMFLIIPFIFLVKIRNDNELFYLAVVPINFGATSTIFSVCMPVIIKRVIKKIKDSWSSSRSGGSGKTTATGGNSTSVTMVTSIVVEEENSSSKRQTTVSGTGSGRDSSVEMTEQSATA